MSTPIGKNIHWHHGKLEAKTREEKLRQRGAVVWFTGRGYSASLPPFFILLIALVLFTSLNPLRDSVFYFHARPDLFFWISLAQSAVVITVGAWLIPALGVIGSALTVLISIIFLSLAMLYFYLRLAHRPKP